MNMTQTTLSCLLALSLSQALYALPPQVEADRLGLAAKTAMEAKDYKTAVEKLEAMQKLGVKLPDTFSYHYGVSLLETGRYKDALAMFDKYLSQGQGAKFYKEALERYNLAEEKYTVLFRIFIDITTGLMWLDNEEAKILIIDWYGAIDYCNKQNFFGHTGWRLPTKDELMSIIDKSNSPVIKTGFKNTASSYYWSSTSDADVTDSAWYVYFSNGDDYLGNKKYSRYVRCVRDNK